MKKLNIFMISHSFRPLIGGAEVYAETLGKLLVEKGHTVNVFTMSVKNAPKREIINGVNVTRLATPKIPGLRFLFFFLRVFIELLKNRSKTDIIHTYQIYTAGIVSAFFGKIFKKPVIIREGTYSQFYFATLHGFISGRLMKWSMRNADIVYSNNQKFISSMEKNTKPYVLRTPVDSELFSPVKDKTTAKKVMNLEKKFVVLYVGRLVDFKRVSCIIDAASLLTKKIQNMTVLIVGDGPEQNNLKNQVKSLNLGKHVEFVGHVPLKRAAEYFKIADVFVHPAVSDTEHGKEWSFPPTTIYQAMASGIPSVSTIEHQFFESKLPEVECTLITDSSIAAKPDSPKCFSEAILKLYSSKNLRERLGKNGRATAIKKLSWEKQVEKITELYETMLRKNIE